jgi:ribonuclease P protein component
VIKNIGPTHMGRLTKRSEFLRVAAGRRRWAAPGLVLEARKGEKGDESLRIGFTVSRKVGGAVERNRARRRLRAVARSVLPCHAMGGFDYVLIGRKATLTRAYDGLIADLKESLRRVKAAREDQRA